MKTATTVPVPPHESENDETQTLASSTTSPITRILDPDIIHTHILTRLDSTTLIAFSSVSSELRHLCSYDDLWLKICTATWPSLLDPIASHIISIFPGGPRSFFSDAFPSLHHDNHSHREYPLPEELIYAVDIYCHGKPLFSRVQRRQTQGDWFLSWPFDECFGEPNPLVVPIPVKCEEWMEYLKENLSLSWIVIDPSRKRAANLSSCKPVLVQRNVETRDLEVVYAVVMAGEYQVLTQMAQFRVKVMCRWKVGNELYVRRVVMEMEDMERRPVMGREGVMILQSAIENGERTKFDEVRSNEKFHNPSWRGKTSLPPYRRRKGRFVPNKLLKKVIRR